MDSVKILESKRESTQSEMSFSHSQNAIFYGAFYGAFSGLLMGLFIVSLYFFGASENIGLKIAKYLILFGAIGFGLNDFVRFSEPNTFFKKGITFGAITTLIAGLTFIAMNIMIFLVNENYAFGRFFQDSDSVFNLAVSSSSAFFEILVFGMISTLVSLQYLKFD